MSALLTIAANLAFACMAACIKLAATHGVPQGQIVFYRGLISLLLIYAVLRWRGLPLATPHWKAHLSRSIVGFGSMITFFGAISRLPLGTAVTLIYLSPLLLGGMLLVINRERPHPILVLALLGGLCGVVLLLRPSYDSSQMFGVILGLVSAVAAASSALNIRALTNLQEPSWRVVLYFTLFVTLASLPWFVVSQPSSIDATGLLYLLGTGVLATIGQVLYTMAFQRGHALLVAMLGYSQVIFTSLLGYWLWHDALVWASWIGMAMITVSGLLATMVIRGDRGALAKAISD